MSNSSIYLPTPAPQILKRIKGVIEARRAAGEDLPPAPKTAIAGPEYFGLNDAAVRGAGRRHACMPTYICSCTRAVTVRRHASSRRRARRQRALVASGARSDLQ